MTRVVLGLGAIAIPAVFTPHAFDVFARPKTIALEGVVALAVVTFALGWRRGAGVRWPRSVAVGVCGFTVSYIVAAAVGVDPGHSVWGEPLQLQGLVPTLLLVVVLALGVAVFRDIRELELLFTFSMVGGVVVAGYAIVQRLDLDPIWNYLPSGRVFSSLGQANALGAYLVTSVLLAVTMSRQTSGPVRIICSLSAALSCVALVLTMSRAAYLGLVVGVAVMACVSPGGNRWRTLTRWLGALALAGALVVLVAPLRAVAGQAGSRALSATAFRGDESIRIHVSLWHVALAIAADHPATGVGPDNYVLVFDLYRDRILPADAAQRLAPFRPESPHNVFITRLVDGGIGALASYVLLAGACLFVLVRRTLRSTGRERTVLGGAASIAAAHGVTDCFMTGEVTDSYLTWLVVGAAVGVTLHTARA